MIDSKLYTLLKVHETGSFTRAAEQLSLTQPAVSHHIKQLEGELGVKLFYRSEAGLRPTAEGEIVLKYARRLQALHEQLSRELKDEQRRITRLTVGVTHTAESNFIAEALAEYCAAHEGVSIKIITDTINNLYDKLRNYELDLAMIDGAAPKDEFRSVLLDTDFLVLAVSNNNPLALRSSVTLRDIKKERMILRLPTSATRNLFVSHLESRNMSIDEFHVVLEVDNIATIKDLIRRDFGISILPKSVCLDELKKKKITVLPIENLSMIRETNMVYRPDFEHVEILKDIAAAYNETGKLYKTS